MGLFGNLFKKEKSTAPSPGAQKIIDLMAKYQDITDYFLSHINENESLKKKIISDVIDSLVFRPVSKTTAKYSIPISLCILKKEDLKTIGVFQNINNMTQSLTWLSEKCHATRTDDGGISYYSVTIQGISYRFCTSSSTQKQTYDALPPDALLITYNDLAKRAGLDIGMTALREAN